jgi:predicted acyltransferase
LLDHVHSRTGLNWQESIYQRALAPLASPANASLLYALVYVLMCWAAMYILYRKGIFLKI